MTEKYETKIVLYVEIYVLYVCMNYIYVNIYKCVWWVCVYICMYVFECIEVSWL